MSKEIGSALLDHLAQNVTTMATCWKITRQDAVQFFFTDHDVDLLIDGDTYEAASGALPTTLTQKRDAAVDNMEIMSFIESDKITEADIMAGKFDYALVDIFIVNYEDYQVLGIS
jgi:uncharacterized phage protein (TIGR02218 family)